MEKYRKFADEQTGEHPFLPKKYDLDGFDLLIGFFLFPLKAIGLILLMIVMLFSQLLGKINSNICKLFQPLGSFLFFKIFSIKIDSSRVEKTSRKNKTIVLSNFASFSDVFILKKL